MAISTYDELKTAITDWMDRSDITGSAADFVTLAEARLNRELKVVEADVTLTGTINSRSIDVSAYKVIEPIGLFQIGSTEETEIAYKTPGSFPYIEESGEPAFYTLDGDNIDFDRPLNSALMFRFRYEGRFALSDANQTNALLDEHPDIYLSACIVWGSIYTKDAGAATGHKSLLDEFIAEHKIHASRNKKGKITPDPALVQLTSRYDYQEYNS